MPRLNQQLGEIDAAKKDVAAALERSPNLAAALEVRALLSGNEGNYKQAIEDCRELLKVVPKNVQLLSQLGLFHLAAKQPRKAVEFFTTALELDPENFVALRMRGDSALAYGDHARAVADFAAAYKLKPKDSSLLNNYAWVLATSPDDKVRDGKLAVELATAACEETEYKAPHILSTLAASYAESGDWDNAKKWIGKALEIGPSAEHLEQLKKESAGYAEKKPWREKQEEQDAAEPQNRTAAAEKPAESSGSK
ncbi:MAG: tetratricopeptide repeat protein [Pirellulales bacterium]